MMPTLRLAPTQQTLNYALPVISGLSLPAKGLLLTLSENGLQQIDFLWETPEPSPLKTLSALSLPITQQIIETLDAYFQGESVTFNEIPLDLQTGTEFQRRVWQALQTIPPGETRPYRWVAEAVGSPLASRAIGQANRANPIPIIIPCHRVIQSGGALGGYMGGAKRGLNIKSALLQLEAG